MASTRGVQQEEVWAAADALLAEQLRPTIKRVRTKLGRGSPNTVAPMLEAWFAALGRRLGVAPAQDGQGAIPVAVTKCAEALWQAACAAADKQARESLASEAEALARRHSELQEMQAALEQRESALAQTLELAQAQIQEQAPRNTTLQGERAVEREQLQACRESLARAVQERDADRRRSAAEERLLGELTARARKRSALPLHWKTRCTPIEPRLRRARSAWPHRPTSLHSALASLQERLQLGERQKEELQAFLAQARINAASTLEVLTRISAQAAPRTRKARTPKGIDKAT